MLVDAVASVGAEPLEIDAWELDLVMLGLQKAPAGPNGLCAFVANPRGWALMTANPAAPRDSVLSLVDVKERWIDAGRTHLPAYVYEHELRALLAMLDALEDDPGMRRLIARHGRARDATRAATGALGLVPWVAADAAAAAVATLVRPPQGITVAELLAAVLPALQGGSPGLVGPAPGPLAQHALRINHMGAAAEPEPVLAAAAALAVGLTRLGYEVDAGAALAGAAGGWANSPSGKDNNLN